MSWGRKKTGEVPDISPDVPFDESPTPCAVCGQYDGDMEPVTDKARAHPACAGLRPDVIAKVKARS